jgi:chemotaxis signal transduction protein
VNIHGYIFAVMVLADLLQRDRCQETGKMIVLHPSVAHLAFLVGQVTRIVRENDVQFSAPSPAPFSSSLIILPEGDAILLEVFELIGVAEKLVSGTPSS